MVIFRNCLPSQACQIPLLWYYFFIMISPSAGTKLETSTLENLDSLRRSFVGHACILEWFYPEIEELEFKKILVAPSGVYWAQSNSGLCPSFPSSCGKSVNNVIETIEEGGYIFGGEELAQAIFNQLRIDASFD